MLRYVDNRHADAAYEADLKAMIDGLHRMWQLVAGQFVLLSAAAEGDAEKSENARAAAKEMDKEINALQAEIDARVHQMISKNAPQLAELRFILSASKLAGQFERMGDHCKNTVKRILRTRSFLSADLQNTIREIVSHVEVSVMALEKVLLHFDEVAANNVCVGDDAVDKSYKHLVAAVSQALKTDALPNERVADVLFIAKNLERLADHATAIAREFMYIHAGSRFKSTSAA